MDKCSICGVEQKKTGSSKISINGSQPLEVDVYNIHFLTYIKGKRICENCMETYRKIHALMSDVDFSCGGIDYYADGRNLK